MTTSLWLMDNGFFAVRDSAFDTQPDTATWTRIARYDETAHPVLHQRLSDNVKNAIWNAATQTLVINGETVLDAAWITAAENAIATAIAAKQTDASERRTLLQQAEAALNQIASDQTSIAQGKTAAQAATTLAQMRTIVLGMLDVMERICTRQDRVIRVERAIVRNGLDNT